MKLALGPILYYWERDAVFSFYDEIAASSVDIVYLGETVCSRRHLLRTEDWFEAPSGQTTVYWSFRSENRLSPVTISPIWCA